MNLQQQATQGKNREKDNGDLNAFIKAEEGYINLNDGKVKCPKCGVLSIKNKN